MRNILAAVMVASILVISSSHAEQPKAPQARILALQPLTKDFEVIFGNPEVPGEPFVIRRANDCDSAVVSQNGGSR